MYSLKTRKDGGKDLSAELGKKNIPLVSKKFRSLYPVPSISGSRQKETYVVWHFFNLLLVM